MTTGGRAVRGLPLEKKLPLLMTGVLLAVVVTGVIVVQREVRRASSLVTAHKLEESTKNFANLVGGTSTSVTARLGPLTRDSSIRRLIAVSPASERDRQLAQAQLASLFNPAVPTDSTLRSELWDANGNLIVGAGDSLPADGKPSAREMEKAGGPVFLTRFFQAGGRMYYWSAMPVKTAGVTRGYIAQRRRLNAQPQTEKTLASTAHADASILISNSDGSLWATLGGRLLGPPSAVDTSRGIPIVRHTDIAGKDQAVLYSVRAAGTPWTISMELPLAKLGQAQRDVVTRFAAISLILLVLGVIAVWIISRRLASPLARMTAAAEAIARGDYSYRVPEAGTYETAKLGASFNRMATEVEAANRNLLAAADAAEKAQVVAENANAAKANFLAAMSHELRTPLNAIAGYVQLMAMGLRGPLTDEQRTDLERIGRSQRYLLALIEQVLVFTQLEAHTVAIDLTDVAVDDLLRDTETLIKPQIVARDIRYAYEPKERDLVVHADRDKAQQIILNLVTNGAKYTEPGGEVKVSSESRNGHALIHVRDTGPGIP
ncbi:MAG TPA: HAMP domain-containing sensor histidine kinase, partial [Gemmatimonadaceae bacterium]